MNNRQSETPDLTLASQHPTVVDLFCGAGGMALGFSTAGCQIRAAVDNDCVAATTFKVNFAELQHEIPPRVLGGSEGDLSQPDFDQIYSGDPVDILIGGPPCQGFSRVGRGKLNHLHERGVYDHGFENDPRNRLYRSFLDALSHWKPSCVVMENVPGMLNVRGINVADTVAWEISERGYRVGYSVLDASWYGVPQHRERVFFIGFRDDLEIDPRMPLAKHSPSAPSGYEHRNPAREVEPELPFDFQYHYQLPVKWDPDSRRVSTVQEALDDLPPITANSQKGVNKRKDALDETHLLLTNDISEYAALMRGWPGFAPHIGVGSHVCRANPRDYETFRRMEPGDRYPDALKIAHVRLNEKLDLKTLELDSRPVEESDEYLTLLKETVPPYPTSIFPDKWRKLIPDQPSWTVTAHLSKDGYSHIHYDDEQARTITVREAARLQSFPDAFKFSGNLGDRFRQIGNAVPPLLAWRIAENLVRTLKESIGGTQPPGE